MKIIILSFFIVIIQSCSSSPDWKPLNQVIHDRTEVVVQLVHDHQEGHGKEDGTGHTPYLPALNAPPKKVALVSAYVIDPITKHEYLNLSTAKWMDIQHAKTAANQIFKEGFPSMKQKFAKHGMDLLSPAEFLTDDKKKEYYKSFKLQHRPPPVEWAQNFLWGLTHHHKTVMQPADGFSEIYLMSAESLKAGTLVHDETLANSLGSDLTRGLDVDAVLVVLSQFSVSAKNEKGTVLDETSMYMFGPNPIFVKNKERGSEVTSASTHQQVGHHYIGIRAPFKFVYI